MPVSVRSSGTGYLRVARRMRPARRIVPTAAAPPARAIPMYPSVIGDRIQS